MNMICKFLIILFISLIEGKLRRYNRGIYPSIVSLQAQGGTLQICSGILLRPNQALFSAQCIVEKDFSNPSVRNFRHLEHYEIVAGISSILREEGHESRTPITWNLHPEAKFNEKTQMWKHDFGIIKFDSFSINPFIKPLINHNLTRLIRGLQNSENCQIVGWDQFNLAVMKNIPIKPSIRYNLTGTNVTDDEDCVKTLCDTLNYCDEKEIIYDPSMKKCFNLNNEKWPRYCQTGSILICNNTITGISSMYKGCDNAGAPLIVSLLLPVMDDLLDLAHSFANKRFFSRLLISNFIINLRT